MRKLDNIDPQRLAGNPRATLQSWLKYRDVVLSAMNQHPKPFIYQPSSMTPSSVASKLRDAVRGKLAFNYPDNEITDLALARWYSEIVVKHDKENVFIGPPEEVKKTLVGSTPTSSSELSYPTLSFEEISAFTLLLSGGRIVGPIICTQPPDLTLLPLRPNVEMIKRKDGSLVLI
jgi:hypothetical protein